MARQAILFSRQSYSTKDLNGKTSADLLGYHLSDKDNTELYELEDLETDLNNKRISLDNSLIYFI